MSAAEMAREIVDKFKQLTGDLEAESRLVGELATELDETRAPLRAALAELDTMRGLWQESRAYIDALERELNVELP